MITIEISLCMIVKNEEKNITRCLDSVKDCVDEIVIVDTGSTDNTINILNNLNVKLYTLDNLDDFSKARNYSFSKATKDYIFWLDADDILNPNDIDKFKELKSQIQPNIDVISMNYILSYDEDGLPSFSLRRNRIVKRSRNFKWIGVVHEYLEVCGNIIHPDISIIHKKDKEYTNRNLLIYENLIHKGIELSPRDTFYYANELFDNQKYEEAVNQYEKFLSTNSGWIEDIKHAIFKISQCYKLNNHIDKQLITLLRAFKYDIPRPDFCCEIGNIFFNKNNFDTAIFWYNSAIENPPSDSYMGILDKNTYTFIPWIQLCICYFKKGNLEKSFKCNEMAAKYNPNNPAVIHNLNYFKSIGML